MIKSGVDEIDLKHIFALFWRSRIIFCVALILAVFIGLFLIKTAKLKFSSETVIEVVVDTPKPQRLSQVEGVSDISALMSLTKRNEASNLAPKILGRQFLTSLVADYSFNEKLKEFCSPPTKPKFFSLLGLS